MKRNIIGVVVAIILLMGLYGCRKDNMDEQPLEVSEETVEKIKEEAYVCATQIIDIRKHYDPLPEILEADWGDAKIQIADMIFRSNGSMSMDEVKQVLDASETGWTYRDNEEILDYHTAEAFPGIQILNAQGEEINFIMWEWQTPEAQNYFSSFYDENKAGWYVRYVDPVEELLPCDPASVYIAGGLPMYNINPKSVNFSKDDFLSYLRDMGGYEIKNSNTASYFSFLKYEAPVLGITEIPPCIFLNNDDHHTIVLFKDNYWTETTDPRGEQRFTTINYFFSWNDTGEYNGVVYCGIDEELKKKELIGFIKK